MYNFCNENKSNKPESQQSNFGIFRSHKKRIYKDIALKGDIYCIEILAQQWLKNKQ